MFTNKTKLGLVCCIHRDILYVHKDGQE